MREGWLSAVRQQTRCCLPLTSGLRLMDADGTRSGYVSVPWDSGMVTIIHYFPSGPEELPKEKWSNRGVGGMSKSVEQIRTAATPVCDRN